ncbi:MAG: SsgA family sporulation/cell division regulator [Actinomycetes bacterium]|jgi:hypothetical protein
MAAISADLDLTLVLGDDRIIPVAATLTYSIAEPFAVSALFRTTDGNINWVFARELLENGLTESVGEGDVVIWPAHDANGDIICISLSSPGGNALLEADTGELRTFLEASYNIVGRGSESEYVDVDSFLDALFEV